MARPPVRITSDPPRGTFSACTLVLATDPGTAAERVAAAFGALRWRRRASDAAHREGASLWEVGGAARGFFLDDLDVLRLVTPRAAAFFSHGRAVATVQPDGAAHRTVVTLSLVEGQALVPRELRRRRAAPARGRGPRRGVPARRRPGVDERLRPARRFPRPPAVAQAPVPRFLSTRTDQMDTEKAPHLQTRIRV
ncbi:hypothetical protein ACF049_06820 [Cellulosimicrobium funkei]|uniref:hypothetical protein n=1 Tax=Cellulosimicrobium funkei TaxID=264251 RepID=UPI0036F7887B